MGKHKLFNDPIYGLINFRYEFLYDLIDHPFFQRLRRIGQMGFTHMVYPGATHSRFQHAIGALYLMESAIATLRDKGIKIDDQEAEAMCAAMLLHDIGHGPISHSLEYLIVDIHHEKISLLLMKMLNEEMGGRLDLAIDIYNGVSPRKFMHQLVSSQLDLDRMDYITRDSYYTGVAEGTIGYDRIISMLNVKNDELVVEEKAIYSIQKFLVSREIMYKQVYLHKTSIAVEQMVMQFYKRLIYVLAKDLIDINSLVASDEMKYFLTNKPLKIDNSTLMNFVQLDDNDIFMLLKSSLKSSDSILADLSDRILNRKLFKCLLSEKPFTSDFKSDIRQKIKRFEQIDDETVDWYILEGSQKITTYKPNQDEIVILKKQDNILFLSDIFPNFKILNFIDRYFMSFPTG